MSASDKLSHLLALADQGPALRAALAEEIADLLSAWPPDYPASMREVCEALLVKAARDLDETGRARLRVQLYEYPRLVQRAVPRAIASHALIAAARAGQDFCNALAESLGVDDRIAGDILGDESGTRLAIACKGAQMDRCVFSALALLTYRARDRRQVFVMLDRFDTVPAGDAARIVREWRAGHGMAA